MVRETEIPLLQIDEPSILRPYFLTLKAVSWDGI